MMKRSQRRTQCSDHCSPLTAHCSLTTAMDDWKCLNCTCTYQTGCLEEKRSVAAVRERRRYIPPRRLPSPPVPMGRRDPEADKAYRREMYRRRIEARGGTVRARK